MAERRANAAKLPEPERSQQLQICDTLEEPDDVRDEETKAAELIDARTAALINWLEAPLFIDTLGDFHGQSIDDGLLFDEAVSEAMFGIGSCKAGAAKLDAWVKECKTIGTPRCVACSVHLRAALRTTGA